MIFLYIRPVMRMRRRLRYLKVGNGLDCLILLISVEGKHLQWTKNDIGKMEGIFGLLQKT